MVHKRIHKDGQINCDLCPFKSQKGYTLKIYLKKHLAEEHGLGKVLYCNLCNYKTSANNYMTKHMNNTSHLKEKLFLCDKCEYSGWTKESLKRHMEMHNRTTPKYLCNECDYKCYDGSNFKVHRCVKHDSLVLSCAECDYKTKSARSLRAHNKKHTTLSNSSYVRTHQTKFQCWR